MDRILKNKWFPLFIAIIIGAGVLVYYVVSGRAGTDANVRSVIGDPKIKTVDSTEPGKIIVKCKNGETYQLLFDPAQQSYDNLIIDTCGEAGTMENVK